MIFTKEEQNYLIKGLMRTINKLEDKIVDVVQELEHTKQDANEVIILIEREEELRQRIQFHLNIIKKIEINE